MGVSVFDVQFQCAQVTGDGVVVHAGLCKHIAEVVVRLGSRGGNRDRFLQTCCGGRPFPQTLECVAEVDVSLGQ